MMAVDLSMDVYANRRTDSKEGKWESVTKGENNTFLTQFCLIVNYVWSPGLGGGIITFSATQ